MPSAPDTTPANTPTNPLLRILPLLLTTLALILLLWFEIHLLLLALAGILLALFLYRLATLLQKITHIPYWLSLTLVCLLLLGALAGTAWLVGARIADQSDSLQHQLPQAWNQLSDKVRQSSTGQWLLDRAHDAAGDIEHASLLRKGLGLVSSSGNVLTELFTVLVVALFGAATPQLYVRGALRLVPLQHRPLARQLATESAAILWWWILGQLAAMAFIGLITGLAVSLLGVPLALTLALLAALLNFVPNFGPIVAAIPAVLLALTKSPATAGWVLLLYIAIQLIQNQLLTPLIQQKAVQLPPALMILAQLLMFQWAGLLGMALAPPLAALTLHFINRLYVQKTLHDPQHQTTTFWPDAA